MHIYIYIYTHTCVYIYIYMYVYVYVYEYVHGVYMHMHTYETDMPGVCIYTHTDNHTCIHIIWLHMRASRSRDRSPDADRSCTCGEAVGTPSFYMMLLGCIFAKSHAGIVE